MSNRKHYGMRGQPQGGIQMPFGGQVQSIARPQPTEQEIAQAKHQFLNEQMAVIEREIYCRAMGNMISMADMDGDCAFPIADERRDIAAYCHTAAKSYFEAKGVQFREPSTVAREIAARVWCDQEMESVTMDPDACDAIAQIIDRVRPPEPDSEQNQPASP